MKLGWENIPLQVACIIKPPKKEARDLLSDQDSVSFVPMNDLGEFQKGFEVTQTKPLGEVAGSYTYFADNDVLVAKITPCFENGKMGIARHLTNGIGFGSSEFVVLRSRGQILPEYLFYFLSRDEFRNSGRRVMSGAVGHKRIPKDYMEDLQCSTPPYPRTKENRRNPG